MKNILLLILLPSLFACTQTITKIPDPKPQQVKIQVPASLLQYCPPLVTNNPVTPEDVLIEDIDFIAAYGTCRTRANTLIDKIQELTK